MANGTSLAHKKLREEFDENPQITFCNMPPSESVEKRILEKAAKLESFCEQITSCRVTEEAPHRHHHKGKSYHVCTDLTAPGSEIVINGPSKPLKATKITYPRMTGERAHRKPCN